MNRFRERYNELSLEYKVIESIIDGTRLKNRLHKKKDELTLRKLYRRQAVIRFIQEYCERESDKIESREGQGINEFLKMKYETRIKSALATNKYQQEVSTTIYR